MITKDLILNRWQKRKDNRRQGTGQESLSPLVRNGGREAGISVL